jgi:hypothetical protein
VGVSSRNRLGRELVEWSARPFGLEARGSVHGNLDQQRPLKVTEGLLGVASRPTLRAVTLVDALVTGGLVQCSGAG